MNIPPYEISTFFKHPITVVVSGELIWVHLNMASVNTNPRIDEQLNLRSKQDPCA